METAKIQIHGIQQNKDNIDYKFVDQIKQRLFLFDTIGVTASDTILNRFLHNDKKTFLQFKNLIEKQLVFDTNQNAPLKTPYIKGQVNPERQSLMAIDAKRLTKELIEEYTILLNIAHDDKSDHDKGYEAGARVCSILWNAASGLPPGNEYYPLVSSSYFSELKTEKVDVYNVMLEQMPIPHPETPVEHIIEFRENPDNRGRLLAFRSLINKLSHSGYNENEIKQELEHLNQVYKESLRKNNIKFGSVIMEFAFTLISGVPLATKLFSGLLKLRSAQANFTASEMSALGREVSYVHRIRSQFAPQK